MKAQPYTIQASDDELQDLRERLARTRWPSALEGTGWNYGTEQAALQELCAYWREGYDWRVNEARLNALPNFKLEVGGIGIHFIHARSPHAGALPLVMTHGWPGSVYEFHKVIERLTHPDRHGGDPADAFHLVCPSLPGYGFSDRPKGPGMDVAAVAGIWSRLMSSLGYERYGAQGGDWGSVVTSWLGATDPEHVCGIHLNMPLGKRPKDFAPESLTEKEAGWLSAARAFNRNETGYQQIQRTKPHTLGFGLTDSPAGLAAWILEKFRTWSDCGGDVERRFTKDELLTNIMIYWLNGNITDAMRLYYENWHAGHYGAPETYVEVPTGLALFPKELALLPRSWVEASFNVVHWTEMPRGGHFAALEEPALLVEDIRTFFRPYRTV